MFIVWEGVNCTGENNICANCAWYWQLK